MKAALLGFLASVSLGTYAHAQSTSQDALDQATDQAQLTTAFDSDHVDLEKGLFYDDGQARPETDYMARPGRGGGGGGGGFHPAPRPGRPGGGGGGFHPAPRPGRPGGGGGFHPAPRPGRPGGGGGFHPAPRPGRPGGGGGFHPAPRPGRPGGGGGFHPAPGRPVPGRPGRGWGPGHHGGYGRAWHPGHGGYYHHPRWNPGYRWHREYRPIWWYSGIRFPLYFWDIDAPPRYWQCIAFNAGGDEAEPYVGFAPYQDEAAFNAIEACGGESTCYIPPGYCQLR